MDLQKISASGRVTKLYLISLGCPKNRTDTELIASNLLHNDAVIVDDPLSADMIMINTCGFITDAEDESIEEIFKAIKIKKETGAKVMVAGCLISRHSDVVKKIPEVDFWFDTKDLWFKNRAYVKTLLSTFPYSYIKIADGCSHTCSFCTIPSFKGKFRSIPPEIIIQQAKQAISSGIKELILVAQDSSYYGKDSRGDLSDLLTEFEKIEGNFWIRTLYLYPTEISDKLINTVSHSKKIVPYFDIPIQHASSSLLMSMKRGYNQKSLLDIILKIRNKISNAIFRTTIIVGYPGETDKNIEELKLFLQEVQFDNVGVFVYRDENHLETDANRISEKKALIRKNDIMRLQEDISFNINKDLIGKTLECLADSETTARSYKMAPQIDGAIHADSMKIGKFYKLKIDKADSYDLYGKISE